MRTNRQARQLLNLERWNSNSRKASSPDGSGKPIRKGSGRKKKA